MHGGLRREADALVPMWRARYIWENTVREAGRQRRRLRLQWEYGQIGVKPECSGRI
ncbi:hypothetical protein [Paenibacillus faecis]|uniref:hypothetical protein n=1 Tax=Paenibacillus faecis TaxID=862114 RepID=UPI0014791FE7|nr:hypothetical protein [Paenibacillus faecis]